MGTPLTVRQARRDDVPALHRVRMAVRENRLTSTALTEDDYIRALEPPCRTFGLRIEYVCQIASPGTA